MTETTVGPVKSQSVLGEFADDRINLFHHIRAGAAVAVLISHAFPICGQTHLEPLQKVAGVSMGYVAVATFFCLSGFLITRSWDRQPDLKRFAAARFLRICPGLWVALGLTAFLLGPLVTTLPVTDYFTSREFLDYLTRNGSVLASRFSLPGVFESNPEQAVNGSLWTLPFEMYCYVGTVVLGLMGLIRARWPIALVALASLLAFIAVEGGLIAVHGDRLARLLCVGSLFASGAVFYVWRDSIRIHERGAAAALLSLVVAMAVSHQAFRISLHLLLPYLLFCGAYLPRRFAARFAFETDLSYGIYIYAFPVQQLIQHSLPHCTWWQNVLLALPVTLALAAASWFLIERPAMSMIRQRRTVSRSQHSVPVDSSTKPAHNSTRIAA